MFPELYSLSFGDVTVPVTTFGVFLTLSFALFYWMLTRLGRKYQINTSFLSINLLSFFLATFLIARLSHVFLYAGLPTKSAFSLEHPLASFFLMSDFYFSLGGALVGFFGVFFFYMRDRSPEDRDDALDVTAIAWLFAAIVGYLGAFLGGQTYGVRADGLLSVDYIGNPILAEFPRFPLAVVYCLCILVIFSFVYVVRKLRPERGLSAALAATLWGIMWFIGEWWNDASSDNLSALFGLLDHIKIFNFNQYIALVLIIWGMWRLAHIIPSPISDKILSLGEKITDWYIDHIPALSKFSKKVLKSIRKRWK